MRWGSGVGAVAATAVALALTTGCGTSDPSAAPAATTPAVAADPCAQIAVADLDRATGWDLRDGARATGHEQTGQAVCNWERADGLAAVQVQLHAGAGRELWTLRRGALAADGLPPARAVTITGADEAFEVPGHGIVAMVVGVDFVQVATIGTTDGGPVAAAVAAAVVQGSRP